VPVFLVRTRLPEATADDVRSGVARVEAVTEQLRREGFRIRCLDSTFVPSDGWLGCLYEADTAVEVRLATERAVLPFDDIVDVIRYGVDVHQGKDATNDQQPAR
jgi:hypothetical protein